MTAKKELSKYLVIYANLEKSTIEADCLLSAQLKAHKSAAKKKTIVIRVQPTKE